MSDEDRIDDLLLRWEEMFDQGQDVAPEKLCDDFPDLIPAVRRATEDLKRMGWLKRAGGEGETISPRPRHVHTPTSVGVPRLIAGQYRLDELLGEGGFGQVWRGVDLELKRSVAVKVPKPGRSTGGAEAFLAEAQKVARLEHPGIVPVHAVARHGSAWYIVSKLIEGTDLRRRLAEGRLPVREAVRIVVAVAEALTYAHERNIVHRDIKPSNLLLDSRGGVYVTDFGIALDLEESQPTDTQAAGTLGYMAPEQFLGESGVIDARTDIYGLGVVLYEMLTGLLPFPSATLQAVRDAAVNAEPPPPRTIDAGVPKEIQRICLKCLAKSPEGRYQTAKALTDDLVGWLNPRKRRYLLMGAVIASFLFASILAADKFSKERTPSDGTSLADEKETPGKKTSLRPAVGPPPDDEKRPVTQANNLDVETVFAAPEKYTASLVEFDRVRVHGAMKQGKVDDNTQLTVETRKGLLVADPALRNQGYGFYAPAELAVRLREQFDPKGKYLAKITCQLTQWNTGGKNYWRGRVVALSLYGRDDKIQRTIACDADMVNAEPEKSIGKMFVFDGLILSGRIGEPGVTSGYCPLTLRTVKGTSLQRLKEDDRYSGLRCCVSSSVRKQLRALLDPTKHYRVRLTCKVDRVRFPLTDIRVCRGTVSVVTLLEADGSEGRTFRDMD